MLRFDVRRVLLIAGTTGGGKVRCSDDDDRNVGASYVASNLRLYLVDLKNTDLKPFRRLPHGTVRQARKAEARQAITWVHREVRRRRYGRTPPPITI